MKGNWFYFAPAEATFTGNPYLVGPFNTQNHAKVHAQRAHKATGGEACFENPKQFVFIQAVTAEAVKKAFIEADQKW